MRPRNSILPVPHLAPSMPTTHHGAGVDAGLWLVLRAADKPVLQVFLLLLHVLQVSLYIVNVPLQQAQDLCLYPTIEAVDFADVEHPECLHLCTHFGFDPPI